MMTVEEIREHLENLTLGERRKFEDMRFFDTEQVEKALEEIYTACNDERAFEIQNRLGELLKKLKGEKR